MFLDEERLNGHRTWLMRLLTRKPHTEREVLERLLERGLASEEAEGLLEEFRMLQLLDDTAYSRLFAEGHEGWGNDRIDYELSRRGVSREDIRTALSEVDEQERARELVGDWLDRGMELKRIIGRLRARGFSGRTINSVTREDDETPW
ncbi:MAG: regulatory protein RecX [Fretibacterium sp.]|nr:regulatory protein RecX [Fretibacterium sp.]